MPDLNSPDIGGYSIAPIREVLTQTVEKSRMRQALSSQGRIPPQSLDMEEAVLGALMLEKEALNRIVDILRPEMFYKDSNKVIYEAVIALFQNSEPVDLLTVKNYLSQNAKLDIVGGIFYLTELTARVASAANIEYHARIIAQKYLLRELVRIGDSTVRDAYDETTDVFNLLDKTEQSLFSLSETNLRRNYMPMSDLVITTLRKLEELRHREGGITGIASGFRTLDEYTSGFQSSDLIICAARPAMGKTAFTLTLARNAAVKFGHSVAFFSLEMAATQIVQRLLCAEAEIDAQKMRSGQLQPFEWQQLNSRIGELSKSSLFIDDTPALSIMDLRAKARRLKAEKGISMIIIDYLQLMTGNASKGGNREQEIAGISRSLKELAKEINVPIIALSQLSRAVETRGGDKRPMLSDLRESGSIEQDADMVMFLYRPEYYGLATYDDGSSTRGICEVIISKQRNGPVGEVKLQFINKFAKFVDLEDFSADAHLSQMKGNDGNYPSENSGSIIMPSKMNKPGNDDDTFEGDFSLPF